MDDSIHQSADVKSFIASIMIEGKQKMMACVKDKHLNYKLLDSY